MGRKSNFQPLQLDYEKLCDMREQAQQSIKKDLDINIIQFHQNLHTKQIARITQLEETVVKLTKEKEQLVEEVERLKEQVGEWRRNQPICVEQGVQVYFITTSKGGESSTGVSGVTSMFLQNVVTPFSFDK